MKWVTEKVVIAAIAGLTGAIPGALAYLEGRENARAEAKEVGLLMETITVNCRSINALKDTLRTILLAAGADGSQDPRFISESINLLQTTDCSKAVE